MEKETIPMNQSHQQLKQECLNLDPINAHRVDSITSQIQRLALEPIRDLCNDNGNSQATIDQTFEEIVAEVAPEAPKTVAKVSKPKAPKVEVAVEEVKAEAPKAKKVKAETAEAPAKKPAAKTTKAKAPKVEDTAAE